MVPVPTIHFAIDTYFPACGAEVPNLMALTPHLTGVTCALCQERVRSLKPNFDGIPLDIELDAQLKVGHSLILLKTQTLSVRHQWVFAGKRHWRLTIEDEDAIPFTENRLAVELGWRLPDVLDDFLYNMDQRHSYTARLVYGRTRGGSAPRCAFIEGKPPGDDSEPRVCKSFCPENDPRYRSDADHLAHELQTYFGWVVGEMAK